MQNFVRDSRDGRNDEGNKDMGTVINVVDHDSSFPEFEKMRDKLRRS